MISCNDAGADLVTHSLGSCIGVTAYDPVRKVGGLLHLMLPDSSIDATKAAKHPFMFADTGLPRLFHAVYALGGEKGGSKSRSRVLRNFSMRSASSISANETPPPFFRSSLAMA